MQEYTLDNGLKLIYRKGNSSLTSISISVDAGAGTEEDLYGVAHAAEHMVYKGTYSRSEGDINKELSDIFGFQNAMTNYPYVIYYGTLLKEDFSKGLELFSDIILNPKFSKLGFKEEMDVIKEELKEWDDDLEQFTEDRLFYNNFNDRRIKFPIIGRMEDLEKITLDNIKDFYSKRYIPKNISVAVVTELDFEDVKKYIIKFFGDFKREGNKNKKISYETFKEGIYEGSREGGNSSRIMRIYPIHELSNDEIKVLRIINVLFGEGVNSILYTKLRTERGLVYDVLPFIGHENYIKLYKIGLNTSKEKIKEALEVLDLCIESLEKELKNISEEKLSRTIKSFKLKRLFREEQSIVLAKELSTYDTMFGDYKVYDYEFDNLDEITKEDLLNVFYKVFNKSSTEIITN